MTDSLRQRPGDQPLPVPNNRPSAHDLVIADLQTGAYGNGYIDVAVHLLEERKAVGLKRYGSLLQAFNGRDARRDGEEEMTDLIVYMKTLLEEHREAGTPPGPMLARADIIYNSLLHLLVDMATLSLPVPKPRYGDGEQVSEPADGDAS